MTPLPTRSPGPHRAFRLRGSAIAIEFHADGLRHPRSVRFGGEVFTPYESVTHVVGGAGGLRLGTRQGSYWFRSGEFAEPGAHAELERALRARAAAAPGGAERMARMERLDALAARPGAAPVSAILAAACVLVFLLQLRDPSYHAAGFFSALLVRLGEPWRLVTANLLHASPAHLVMNGLGLSLLGALAERSLGSPRLGPVLALAGLGSMAASYAAGYQNALGASGLVAGLAGALLWLEFRAPEALPVGWRLPRRLFVGVLGLDVLVLMALPGIAHAAHAGGFAAGGLGAAVVGPRLDAGRPRVGLRLLNALALATVLLAGASWVQSVRSPDAEALAERGERLLARSDVPPAFLNDEAWRIAISEAPSAAALETARRMAERAAQETGWSEPPILDTLAEIHFQAGRTELALDLADEAVALAPGEPYYEEQRKRFAGERAPEDRPAGPEPGPPTPPPAPRRIAPPAAPGPGLRV